MARRENLNYSSLEVDALREAGNIGIGRVATVLSKILATRIEMTVPQAEIRQVWDALELAGGAEQLVAALYLRFQGEWRGSLLFFFDQDAAESILSKIMVGKKSPLLELGELERSALEELGNILLANFLTALSELSGLYIRPKVPTMAIDMAGAIIQEVMTLTSEYSDHALLITTELLEAEGEARGHLLILPDARQLQVLLSALGVEARG
jgi:chemotaxis protein CheC